MDFFSTVQAAWWSWTYHRWFKQLHAKSGEICSFFTHKLVSTCIVLFVTVKLFSCSTLIRLIITLCVLIWLLLITFWRQLITQCIMPCHGFTEWPAHGITLWENPPVNQPVDLWTQNWLPAVGVRTNYIIAPAGFWPRGQNPRRHPRSPRAYTYSTRTKHICWKSKKCVCNGRKILDLTKLGTHGGLG